MKKHTLDSLIQKAWKEIQADDQLSLSPWTKLDIYDYLINSNTISLKQLHHSQTKEVPDDIYTLVGMKKYFYLGILTVEKAFPIWERDMTNYMMVDPHWSVGWTPLPYIMHRVALERLKGSQVGEHIIKGDDNYALALDMPHWWANLGNIAEEVIYTQQHAVWALYSLNFVVEGFVPYQCRYDPLSQNDSDKKLDDKTSNFDFTYHTLQAMANDDPNTPGWDVERTQPVRFIREKALEFWNWWLFEAVYAANEVNIETLDWDIFAKDKYQELFINFDDNMKEDNLE